MEKPKINDNERKVLEALVEAYSPDDWRAYAFADLVAVTKLELPQVRRCCRSLAKKNLARFERTLWDMDEGRPAGAGYHATHEGAAFINPCDICGGYISYDYYVDENGQFSKEIFPEEKGHRLVRECEQHYKQSAERPVQAALTV